MRPARMCLWLSLLALPAAPAAACSVAAGYRVPTSLDLAASADTIVIAVVGRQRGAVVARPAVLLKGRALPGPILLRDSLLDVGLPQRATRSDPRELRAPHPETLSGSCVRYTFGEGMKLVLFLERDRAGRLVPRRSPFARDAEDVPHADALWVKAVREYAAISVAPPAARPARLRVRIAQLRTRRGDADAAAIARDMAIELGGRR